MSVAPYHEPCLALEMLLSLAATPLKTTLWRKVHAVIFMDHVP